MADERHRIELACPECGHRQVEPALVISTQCRSCRSNYQVRDGKSVARLLPKARLASASKPPKSTPSLEEPKPRFQLRTGPTKPPPQSFLMRLLNPSKPPRQVRCFNCGNSFTAAAEAQSSQCPKCCGYISLLDHDITENWNRQIQTGGNVVIQKNGSITGATLQCHHLTILGSITSSIECSGDLIIRSHGKILGSVQCDRLLIEKGARVEFLHPVNATSANIDGQVRGQIFCTGPVSLQKKAHLRGLVRTSSLIVKPGAKHTGTVEMINTPVTQS